MRLQALLLALTSVSRAFRLHSYFTPGMILQRDVPTTIWGYQALGEVTAALSCQEDRQDRQDRVGRQDRQDRQDGQDRKALVTRTREDGLWQAELPPQPAGRVCQFEASTGGEDIVLTDVMFGDVWLCSGQSNMEQSMLNIMNATEEIKDSASFTSIRYTVVKNAVSVEADPDMDVELQQPWADASDADRLKQMSAVCFLFARSLQKLWREEGRDPVPLGLVDSDWGGTPIEAWSTPESLASCDSQRACDEDRPQGCPSRLYNAMIKPLARVALTGFLWYQGESNSGGAPRDIYNCTFPAMIDAWRQEFSSNSATAPDAHFGFVQLASYRPDVYDNGFPVIRWHQTADYGFVPNPRLENVFMASPLDTYDDKEGYPGGIHPRYKQIVGERLAVAGMYVAYGQQQEPYRPYGPLPTTVDLAEDTITLTYSDRIVYDNTEISGFYICQLDPPGHCDDSGSGSHWLEVPRETVSQVDDLTLRITSELPAFPFSLAYAWRETPVKRYLGLPVYGDAAHFSLPSPPWKKACGGTSCV